MITIIQNVSIPNELILSRLREKFQEALQQLTKPDSEVTIVLDSDQKLRELKMSYLGVDEIPDVLSFTSSQINPETENLYLGDIIISLEKASDQAIKNNHPIELEILTLGVHGLLHLLNFDHSIESDAKNMFNKQEKILEAITNNEY